MSQFEFEFERRAPLNATVGGARGDSSARCEFELLAVGCWLLAVGCSEQFELERLFPTVSKVKQFNEKFQRRFSFSGR